MKQYETSLLRLLAALSLATLSACQSLGNGKAFQQTAAERSQALQPGVSTREQVQQELGDAHVYTFADGRQAWTYQRTTGIPKWVQFLPYLSLLPLDYSARTAELALLFDARGVLRKVEWRSGAAS